VERSQFLGGFLLTSASEAEAEKGKNALQVIVTTAVILKTMLKLFKNNNNEAGGRYHSTLLHRSIQYANFSPRGKSLMKRRQGRENSQHAQAGSFEFGNEDGIAIERISLPLIANSSL
jgi:hypothetical protein